MSQTSPSTLPSTDETPIMSPSPADATLDMSTGAAPYFMSAIKSNSCNNCHECVAKSSQKLWLAVSQGRLAAHCDSCKELVSKKGDQDWEHSYLAKLNPGVLGRTESSVAARAQHFLPVSDEDKGELYSFCFACDKELDHKLIFRFRSKLGHALCTKLSHGPILLDSHTRAADYVLPIPNICDEPTCTATKKLQACMKSGCFTFMCLSHAQISTEQPSNGSELHCFKCSGRVCPAESVIDAIYANQKKDLDLNIVMSGDQCDADARSTASCLLGMQTFEKNAEHDIEKSMSKISSAKDFVDAQRIALQTHLEVYSNITYETQSKQIRAKEFVHNTAVVAGAIPQSIPGLRLVNKMLDQVLPKPISPIPASDVNSYLRIGYKEVRVSIPVIQLVSESVSTVSTRASNRKNEATAAGPASAPQQNALAANRTVSESAQSSSDSGASISPTTATGSTSRNKRPLPPASTASVLSHLTSPAAPSSISAPAPAAKPAATAAQRSGEALRDITNSDPNGSVEIKRSKPRSA